MNDAELIEQVTDLLIANNGLMKINTAVPLGVAKEIINKVREHDKHNHASFALDIAEKARKDGRAKTIEDIVDVGIDELRNRKGFRHWWDNWDYQDDVIECLKTRIRAMDK